MSQYSMDNYLPVSTSQLVAVVMPRPPIEPAATALVTPCASVGGYLGGTLREAGGAGGVSEAEDTVR